MSNTPNHGLVDDSDAARLSRQVFLDIDEGLGEIFGTPIPPEDPLAPIAKATGKAVIKFLKEED